MRLPLFAATAALALHAATASAAPPVGCYGLPSVPQAFVCVVSFTPENAVPGATADPDGQSVTIPAFCAGDCFGPFTVPIPTVSFGSGSGQVMVLVYQGDTYPIVVGQVPPLPPVDVPQREFYDCPGEAVTDFDLSPYVCLHNDGDLNVGTCLTARCTVVGIPIQELGSVIRDLGCPVRGC